MKDEKQIYLKQLFKKRILHIFLIIISGFSVYYNSLTNNFIWDDKVLIIENQHIRKWAGIKEIFTSDIGTGYGKEYQFYRPLQMLTYLINYSFWGKNVKIYHITNILLHTLVAIFIFWLLNILFNNVLISFLTSILFVIHPIHTEAIAYISGLADPLAAVFILLSFITYIKYRKSNIIKFYILGLLFYIFAILSKEYSLILPILFIVYDYIFMNNIKFMLIIPTLMISFFYILFRVMILGSIPVITFTDNLYQRIIIFFVSLAEYVRLLFLPLGLHMEYNHKLVTLFNFKAVLGFLGLFLLLILAVRKKKDNQIISFSIIWFLVTIFPQSSLYSLNAYMAEHWLYLPSFGFFLLFINSLLYLSKFPAFKNFLIIFFLSILTFYCFLTIRQNNYWRDPVFFYERNLKFNPNSPKLLNNLALEYRRKGEYEKAIGLYKKAIESDPFYIEVYNNLGVLYTIINNFEDAVSLYKRAIEINPNYAKVYNNFGKLYSIMAKNEEAIKLYKRAIEINPNYAVAHSNLAETYYDIKRYDLAIKHCDKAIELGYSVNPEFLKLIESFRK